MRVVIANAGLRTGKLAVAGGTPLAVALLSLMLAGCAMVPRGGPSVSTVEEEGNKPDASFPYKLIPVTASSTAVLRTDPDPSLTATADFFRGAPEHDLTLGAGDVLSITILEPAAGGLFTGISSTGTDNQGAKVVTLPNIQIDRQGMIPFPFVGKVKAAGRTPMQLGAVLEGGLNGKSLQPQVIVSVATNFHNKVVVTGIAKSAGQFELSPARETLLQLIVKAGGPAQPTSDVIVELTRNGETRRIRLQQLLDNPTTDIPAEPGDFINLVSAPRTYAVLGATYKVGQYPLPPSTLTLSGALSAAGGPDDSRAHREGIFLLRYESPAVAAQLAPDVDTSAMAVPVVYQIDDSHAGGFFLPELIPLHDKDIIYVGNARLVEWSKVLSAFRLVTTPIVQATITGHLASE
jgi:polysaccharide export outer membrane protein